MRKLHTADVIAIDAVESGAITSSAIAPGARAETLRRPQSISTNWRMH